PQARRVRADPHVPQPRQRRQAEPSLATADARTQTEKNQRARARPMQARAKARYVRVTPRKARRVVDLIRGLPAEQAQAVLTFAPQSASDPVGKVLASAIANAEQTGQAT